MKYIAYTFELTHRPDELTLETAYDLLSAELAEIGFESFEQNETCLRAYIPVSTDIASDIPTLLEQFPLPGLLWQYSSEIQPDINWNEQWEKNFFRPIRIEDKCLVRAPFHPTDPDIPLELIISPQMAFGTGHHETTSLMISYLLDMDLRGLRVLDMGCGTGILAILARKLGASSVTAIDIDDWCIRNTSENAALNDIRDIDVRIGDASLLADCPIFDLIIANINRNILLNDMSAYRSRLGNGGTLLLSGFYTEDIPILTECAGTLGLTHSETRSRNNWAALRFTADSPIR
ncbi:release factor glutamine methyltransferase [Porphyromonas gingivalis]|uniref:50S ribosomal protein L11 methyltransferase n=1 Tax=Porphyromonas gingivalis TaxID=837 RepID=UPI0030A832B1